MALESKYIGRKYGPYHYEVGVEKVREFALCLSGEIPSMSFDEGFGPLSGHFANYPEIVPPTFAAVYNIRPFSAAIFDPELEVNVMMLVHGEQAFELRRPVRPGDSLTTSGEIVDIAEKAGKKFLVVKSTTQDARGEVVTVGTWTAVIRA